jgi:stress response protein YsnF
MVNENNNSRLHELRGSNYEIVEDQPDIHNWDVKDSLGKRIGEVDELIFDEQSRKVRYIVVDLDDNELGAEHRDVLVPIGLAELNENDDDVILPSVTAAQLNALPEYKEGEITQEIEIAVRRIFGGASESEEDFYKHEHFNPNNLYRRRRQPKEDETSVSIPVINEELQIEKRAIETGGVKVRTSIKETPVEENVVLKEEHVYVERHKVERPATEADFSKAQDKEIEVTEQAEVPVVNKEARVVEEVNVKKDVEERDKTIRDTVRNTEVDIEKLD